MKKIVDFAASSRRSSRRWNIAQQQTSTIYYLQQPGTPKRAVYRQQRDIGDVTIWALIRIAHIASLPIVFAMRMAIISFFEKDICFDAVLFAMGEADIWF